VLFVVVSRAMNSWVSFGDRLNSCLPSMVSRVKSTSPLRSNQQKLSVVKVHPDLLLALTVTTLLGFRLASYRQNASNVCCSDVQLMTQSLTLVSFSHSTSTW